MSTRRTAAATAAPARRPRRRHRRALLLLLLPTPALANITSTGDVSPPVNVTGDASVPGTLLVGNTAAGQIALSATSALSSDSADIGYSPGSTGAATLADSSSWSVANGLEIGDFSAGSLALLDASSVSADFARVGTSPGGDGQLQLSGTSTLSTAGDFEVGSAGTGSLSLDASARVIAGFGSVALLPGSNGTVTLAGPSVSLFTTYGLSVGGDGQASLSVTAGTLSPGWLNIGEKQSTPGGSGSVSLDGPDSSLSTPAGIIAGLTTDGSLAASNAASVSADFLEVARSSTGSLSLSSGATLSANSVTLATDPGSSATATLQSAHLAAPDFLTLATGGTATLSASAGTTLTTGPVNIAYAAGSTGAATLTGPSTTWTINPTSGASAYLTVGYQGDGRLDLLDHATLSADSLSVGWTGRGTLNVAGGAQLTAASNITLAVDPASSAAANVTGPASALATTGFLEVAHSGAATLSLSAGASLSNASAIVGLNPGSSGTVTLDNAAWTSSTFMTIGNDGAGSVAAHNASTITVTQGAIVALNHDASLLLDGPGTTFATSDTFELGRAAHGTLTVQNGARLSAAGFITLSSDTPGTATALVTGANSLIDSPSLLTVGNFGAATLTVQAGGRIHTASAGSSLGSAFNLAGQPGSTGSATFTGPATSATFDGNVNVGLRGAGSLTIEAGATLTSHDAFLARLTTTPAGGGPPSTPSASVTLTGPGSSWSLSGSLYVGGSDAAPAGPATLTLQSSASLSVAGALTVWPTGSVSVENASLSASSVTVAGSLTAASSLSLPSLTLTTGGSATLLPNIPTPSTLGSLTIFPGATLDLTTNTLLLDAGAPDAHPGLAQLRQYLHDSQLLSSTANADPQHLLTLGYLLNPASNTITIQPTLQGDSNLDGTIDPDDYTLLDRAYARSLSNAHWSDGDFNYDGTVDANDYLLIDTTLGQAQGFSPGFLSHRESQFGAQYISTLLATVPEPSLLLSSILYLLPSLLPSRRRRTFQ